MAEGNLVTIATFRDPWEAHIVAGLLQSEEIANFVIHEHHIWMQWPLSTALGGVKVQVHADETNEAQHVLKAWADNEYAGLLEDYEPVFHPGPCPRCAYPILKPVFSARDWLELLVLLFLILGPVYPARRHRNQCQRCSYTWNRELPT